MTASSLYYANAGEHRHRSSAASHSSGDHAVGGNRNNAAKTGRRAAAMDDSSPSSSIAAVVPNADDAAQKYNKRSKTCCMQRQPLYNRFVARHFIDGNNWNHQRKRSAAQMVIFIMLFTALLNMSYQNRTVLFAQRRIQSNYIDQNEEEKSIYQRAGVRIAQLHHEIHPDDEARERELNRLGKNKGSREMELNRLRKHAHLHREEHEPPPPPPGEQRRQDDDEQQQQQQQPPTQQHRTQSESKKDERSSNSEDGRGDEEQNDESTTSSSNEQHQMEDEKLSELSTGRLQELFLNERNKDDENGFIRKILKSWLIKIDADIINNVHGGIRWIRPYLLPPIPGQYTPVNKDSLSQENLMFINNEKRDRKFFEVRRNTVGLSEFKWEDEWEQMIKSQEENSGPDLTEKVARKLAQPIVDYTSKDKYKYPQPLLAEPPPQGGYPKLTSLGSLMGHWDQDEDFEGTITETLLHFNFSNPDELEMARRFRDAELPFKLIDVPELDAANLKWTDEYVSKGFDDEQTATGNAQESPNHYFAYFTKSKWNTETMGLAPTRNNNWSFRRWSQHAQYADAKRLSPDQPHFYWQARIDQSERHLQEKYWSFISRDLPSWSSSTETFMVFHPESQKGIQCRFGERGVVAATHYDGGRNMIGMVTGAKRYILSPPKECSNLGLFTSRESPIYRHSLLNFGHIKYLNGKRVRDTGGNSMPAQEQTWLERAAQAQAVETVLKAGEVLFIPSFWFHSIISLQKSAQCNVRSGAGKEGTSEFGGKQDVLEETC